MLGNFAASGTEIIRTWAPSTSEPASRLFTRQRIRFFRLRLTKRPFRSTRLYQICEIARRILDGEHKVGRVIARPFLGEPGNFYRTENRHDYAVPPPRANLLPALKDEDLDVVCIGKIASIYDSVGVTEDLTAKNNQQSIDQTIHARSSRTRAV